MKEPLLDIVLFYLHSFMIFYLLIKKKTKKKQTNKTTTKTRNKNHVTDPDAYGTACAKTISHQVISSKIDFFMGRFVHI